MLNKMPLSRAGKLALFNGLALMVLVGLVWHGQLTLVPLLPYTWHKLLHLMGVVVFAGNLMVGPVWVIVAFLSKDIHLLKYALKVLLLTDMIFTIPGLDLAVVNGLFLASAIGGIQSQPWLTVSVVLVTLTWLLSLPVLVIQERLNHVVQSSETFDDTIQKQFYQWGLWGSLVSIPPAVVFGLMILKQW